MMGINGLLSAKSGSSGAFGFRDLKGKGAAAMRLAGTSIEQIQSLWGHTDKLAT